MKKLLLLTDVVCFFFLFASCHNSQKDKSENVNDSKQTIKDIPIATDTTKILTQTPVSGTIDAGQEMKKDTTKKPANTHAIIHQAPEQGKIDSIKNSKNKTKK